MSSLDERPSPVPIHEVETGDPDLKLQQFLVGRNREGRPYVLSIKSHRDGTIVAWLGQTLGTPAHGQGS